MSDAAIRRHFTVGVAWVLLDVEEALGEPTEGTNGLRAAVDDITGDLEELRESASEATADEAAALDDAISTLDGALASAGNDLSEESACAALTAIDDVRSALNGLGETLADC